ncbi:uncharacterized protein K02A2.6-like [Uranotaenia lowii]|uniref:uncharacterized protein K02A2.6-like n=1 Tax=Uranotaenia lowii TaxID=190385 RepID=UPI00247A1DF0|nr:uncharacterized protein K02A2.6-like [Uranotaenia lowii]
MDQQAVNMCESCEGCRLVQATQPPEPMKRRMFPDKPWTDLAIDFLGPMPTGEHILVIIDYFTRYMEISVMNRITAEATIKTLRNIFRNWGNPRTITLDNAKQFVSKEFGEFCRILGITLNHTTPYWPQANGEDERQNRSLLKRLKISKALHGDWKKELDDYLIMYNNTPHCVTGVAPSELLQNRKLRFKIPQFDDLETVPPTSSFHDRDVTNKFEGKEREDKKRKAKPSEIQSGDTVLVKNLVPQDKLSTNFHKEKYSVVDKKGSNVTIVGQDSDKRFERNSSHLLKVTDNLDQSNSPKQRELPYVRQSSRIPKPSVRYSP